MAETESEISVPVRIENRQRLFQVAARVGKISPAPGCYAICPMSDASLGRIGLRRDAAQEGRGMLSHWPEFAAKVGASIEAISDNESFRRVLDSADGNARPLKSRQRFRRSLAVYGHQRVAQSDLQLQRVARLLLLRSVGARLSHGDRLAEMDDRFLEGRAAKGLIARLAPPFNGEVVEAGLSEMMRDRFGLGRGALGLVAQNFSGAAVQRLAAALEQALIGRVLDQRVFEEVVRLRSIAVDEQDVGLGEPLQSRPESGFVETGHGLKQHVREAAPKHGADLGDLPRRAEPVEPRGERL